MSKVSAILICAALLAGGLSRVASLGPTAYAADTELDMQCTEVRYSVDATVVFTSDDIHMVQKVPVGQILIPPQVNVKPGYTFSGWIDAATGDFWDFTSPVTGDLHLIARYLQDVSFVRPTYGQIAKTADAALSPVLPAALAGVGLAAVACGVFVMYRQEDR